MIKSFFIILFSVSSIYCQVINFNGSILQKEFTYENKIAGFYSIMNNTEREIIVKVTLASDSTYSMNIKGNRGRQFKVIDNKYLTNKKDLIFGNFQLHFSDKITSADLLNYTNNIEVDPTLRGVGVIFEEFDDDSKGDFFIIKIDWKTIENGVISQTKKCYIN